MFYYLILFVRPTSWKNDPNHRTKVVDPLDEVLKTLKERYKRTVERRINDGEDLVFDEQKGIINEETGEVVLNIKIIRGGDMENSMMCSEVDGDDDEVENLHANKGDENKILISANKENKVLTEGIVDTYLGQDSDGFSDNDDNSDEEICH